MNRRSAILATVLGWLGLSKAKAAAKTIEQHKTCGILTEPHRGLNNGVKFARDVIAYEMDCLFQMMPNGKMYRRTSGVATITLGPGPRISGTYHRLDDAPIVSVPLENGFVRKLSMIDMDGWNRTVIFDFIDHEI